MSAAMNGGAHVAQGIRSEASDDTSVFPNRALSFNWEPAFMADLIDGSMVLPDAPSFKMARHDLSRWGSRPSINLGHATIHQDGARPTT